MHWFHRDRQNVHGEKTLLSKPLKKITFSDNFFFTPGEKNIGIDTRHKGGFCH